MTLIENASNIAVKRNNIKIKKIKNKQKQKEITHMDIRRRTTLAGTAGTPGCREWRLGAVRDVFVLLHRVDIHRMLRYLHVVIVGQGGESLHPGGGGGGGEWGRACRCMRRNGS